MKILYTNFHGGNGGGHVTYIVNLLRGLSRDHSLTVACPETSRLFRLASEVPGVRVVAMSFTTRPSSWFGARTRLRALLQTEHFDIVHVNGSADHKQVMLALLGLGTARPSVVFTKHNDHPLKSFGHRLRAKLATDHVIAVSDYVRKHVCASVYRDCEVTTIRHGIDTNYFVPVSVNEKLSLREKYFDETVRDKIVLGSAGGTDLEKGWLDLVSALASLPTDLRSRFHIVVAGDPPKPQLMDEVIKLGMASQISFPGLIDDIRPLLAACDVGFVLSYQEALSFACRELMALGLPVLVTRVGGLPENLIEGQHGWIVEVRDVTGIAQVLRKIVDQPTLLKQLGAAARAHAEQWFNLSDFSAQTLRVYQHCRGI
ncbi:glycosyltransferase [Zwartia vadi]|uniref:glycosyltransferase n=1 Tax=Zwartia vadi TaxID=3058168 RepID=UPI0025B39731|nr:glycosyltransferase [Zwartia vadi]MDN3988647.1 glycosyltransferase [Zwartia vadi]